MKTILITLILFIHATIAKADDPSASRPEDAAVYDYENHIDPPAKDAKPGPLNGHVGKVLLTVYSLEDLLLQADKKGVRAVLNKEDAKAFAEITRKYQYPVLITGDKVAGVTMHFTAPIEDGSIMFNKANYADEVAQYLRHRYRVKPYSNDFGSAK